MSGYGLLVLGPSLHFWFNLISKILPKQDIITILKKILIGQTTFGPLMTGVFFSVNAFLQGIFAYFFLLIPLFYYCFLQHDFYSE